MKVRRMSAPGLSSRKRHPAQPEYFVFCEKLTGAARFRVPAGADGSFPIEHAASLLAIHCLTRQQTPADYLLMVGVGADLAQSVTSRAAQLLESVWTENAPMPLSKRQQQVLEGVLRNLSNKEIGALLNLSERTVKFHVSTLLAKYGVSDRVSLMRQAPSSLLFAEPGTTGAHSNGSPSGEKPMNLDRRSRGECGRSAAGPSRVVRFPRWQALA